MSPRFQLHLICNAHLDPVWQWRWEEGAAEALATFRNAVDILDEHPGLVFCHNEAVLYQWTERFDPALFADIRRLVRAGRWSISGGWYLQPDVNLPGTESLIRHVLEGRRYFRDRFGVTPRVAYNFDSFGHSGGLPQLLRLAGYEMYIHMRPQAHELALPTDLYRWRGVDGTTIPSYRIDVGLYHTERDNIEERLRAGVELALLLGRDVPVFWGLGNHGGGATREDLRRIDAWMAKENRVRILHSTPDRFFDAVKDAARRAPLVEGDLQRCFTGCYTSLARLKSRAVTSLGSLVQSEAASSAAWWLEGRESPARGMASAWRAHLFNDFHDILTGSCVERAEKDALDLYGKAECEARASRLEASAALVRGAGKSPDLPVAVLNANPSIRRVPVEFEAMAGYRPFWTGKWHLRLFRLDGTEVPCQEEPPEALLPFNDWRRRICFIDALPGVGMASYFLRAFEGPPPPDASAGRTIPPIIKGCPPDMMPVPKLDPRKGLITSLRLPGGVECLSGPLLEPLVIEDPGDSWGTGCRSYRRVAGRFEPEGPPVVLCRGPVRTMTRSVLSFGKSRLVMDLCAYPDWPVLEFRLRLAWNEARRRLKLRIPTRWRGAGLFCEVPGGAIRRPADGEEHVHGRWLIVEGAAGGKKSALGVVSGGQHGFDFRAGEVRLSVLRSSAYCHERGFDLDRPAQVRGESLPGKLPPSWKFADAGVHELRILVTAGAPANVLARLPGLADYLAAPPAVYAHLPITGNDGSRELLSLTPASVRLLACKQSLDRRALIIRVQEATGARTRAVLTVSAPRTPELRGGARLRPAGVIRIPLSFRPFEIKTIRVDRRGAWREADLTDES